MAAWRLLILCSLLSLSQHFEVTEDEWEELSPEMAALHRLKGLQQHMSQHTLRDPSRPGGRARRSKRSTNPMSLLEACDGSECFTCCVMKNEQEFDTFLEHIDEQKTQDLLLSASEVAHSYSQKLLVMTDQDKQTYERVQQEYRMDPLYSVIVSEHCLHDDSCLPKADAYTVVKIFGNVSGNGQKLSGLRGSALAALLSKPSLEAAQIFSLDGETTLDFQHDFIQGFMLSGIRAVLETVQGDHQIYQVMENPDSVSDYRIPKRAADHTTQYEHQQILMLEDNAVVRKAAAYLYEKHPTVSSLYILDENQKPKLIQGDQVPLSETSRLVLVGHGAKDQAGETRLAGYKAQDVAKIVEGTFRVGNKIKTTSVVACKVGSDEAFIKTLMTELHETAHIETELHLRDAVVQVRHTGEKITQEISPSGLQWRHKDDSKKVLANIDRNGDVIIRTQAGSKGEAIFTNENNLLGPLNSRFLSKLSPSWPKAPQRFINQDVFKMYGINRVAQIKHASAELEALSYGFFIPDQTVPQKINIDNVQHIEQQYVMRNPHDQNKWINDRESLIGVLEKCYEITSGKDAFKVIRHFAKTGEHETTYVMLNDWIFRYDPKTLYVYPVGKKLDNNEMNHPNSIMKAIYEQNGKERYTDIREHITNKEEYVQYVTDSFIGEGTTRPRLSTEAWYNTYLAASIISESARNFRTFPLVLMGLDMFHNNDPAIRAEGVKFFFEDHPMAKGQTWIDPSRRGFSGSATPEDSSKLYNRGTWRKNKAQLMTALKYLLLREENTFTQWTKIVGNNDVSTKMFDIGERYHILDQGRETFFDSYNKIKELPTPPDNTGPLPSGELGGYDDGYVTLQDLTSATQMENSFKQESFYSRASALVSGEIHSQLKAKYGENLAGLHLKEGSAKIENGQFICQLVSEDVDAKPAELRLDIPAEGKLYNEKMLKGIEAAVRDQETHGSQSSPHEVNKNVERIGTTVGMVGLVLGMKGAVRAFEQGDIKDGVVATLQTAHGVTAMTMSVVAKTALSSETRIAKAVATSMESPAMRGTMKVIPIVGIGFGIYNIKQDLARGDAMGIIDAVLDLEIVELDVLEIVQPELAPVIAPITVALSVVRLLIDDVAMGIQNELNSLPKDAGVLDKVAAVIVGFGEGVWNIVIDVKNFFYDGRQEEIEAGHKVVAQISDYRKYYKVTQEQGGIRAVDFTRGDSSWNGGGIYFHLSDQGASKFCLQYFVASDERFGQKCSDVDTQGSKDIILGLGESHQIEYKKIKRKVLMFIPAGSVTVPSGYKSLSYSRYGTYKGNRDANHFFAVQTAEDKHVIEIMLSYYYRLYGEPGDDVFYLGPQKSNVEGSGGRDTYIIPKTGGKTTINNYDPSKASDTLHFSVDYSHISVSKSGNDVVLMYEGSHTVTVLNWFSGETYRHMNMVSGDGVMFEISTTVVSSVQLVARGINKMFLTHGETVDTSQPLLRTVTNILGSRHDDTLIGNGEKNFLDGGGGQDRLIGGEREDVYMVKVRKQSSALIENYSKDKDIDLAIIEANLHTFTVRVEGDNVILNAVHDGTAVRVTLVNWFRSPADRHLLIATKDLVTFTVSDHKSDCSHSDPFTKCIQSRSLDYSKSSSALVVDMEKDQAFLSVTEVRGSNSNDIIRGNQERNVISPGRGDDYVQGRGGEDWYVVTPGQGVKTINNQSPDKAMDILFLKEQYEHITSACEGRSIKISVKGRKAVILEAWFVSKTYQHLQIQTSDGVTFGLQSNISWCGESLQVPLMFDYRNQKPKPLTSLQTQRVARSIWVPERTGTEDTDGAGSEGCFTYISRHSQRRVFCGLQGRVMMMKKFVSVKEMYGSSGFDIMVGNSKGNMLDPYTGGALMAGGEGKDTYMIKREYSSHVMIDNFAEDQITDTVLVDMDFLDGSQVTVEPLMGDLNITITSKGEHLGIYLLSYNNGSQHQHLNFESSDGVQFNLKLLNTTGDPSYKIEAFKVTLKQTEVDCRLDLSTQRNLSTVQTVQGCPSHSNDIVGNDQNNALIGGWKDDALDGGDGNDTLIGGKGADILTGGFGDDTLYGGDGDDTMMGNSGWDVLVPGPGADLVDGGPGRDTVLYRGDHEKGQGVYVSLLTGQCLYADAEGDVLKDVETVIGTIYSDVLVSGYEAALLKGSDGDDILVSTGGDYLVGGDGNDIYMLAFSQGSVTIDNCAKDKALDVLYFSSTSPLVFDCQFLSDSVVLKFTGLYKASVQVTLPGWISDTNQCGHLLLVFRQEKVSVDKLLQECRVKQKDSVGLNTKKRDKLFQPCDLSRFLHVSDF
ncbi:uncharacterized protein LOC142996581 [Genypterus blacodes]|uniref:uncharacterized protein LOC142996581 n=1 Tax=Genypterus blacodes TaxID=154954 RepID=UPI003F7665F2